MFCERKQMPQISTNPKNPLDIKTDSLHLALSNFRCRFESHFSDYQPRIAVSAFGSLFSCYLQQKGEQLCLKKNCKNSNTLSIKLEKLG